MADYPIYTTYYVVSGAGTSEFNGNYFYTGTHNGQPYYTKLGTANYNIFWGYGDTWACWVIDVGLAIDYTDIDVLITTYFTYPGTTIDGTYYTGMGEEPAPTVTAASTLGVLILNGVRGKWLNDGEGLDDYITGVSIPSVYNVSGTQATVNVCAALYKDDGEGNVDFVTESAEVGIVYSENGGLYVSQDIDIYFPTVINPDYNTYYFAYVWSEIGDLRVDIDMSDSPSADYGHYIDDSTGYNNWPATEVNQTSGSKMKFEFITTNTIASNISYSADVIVLDHIVTYSADTLLEVNSNDLSYYADIYLVENKEYTFSFSYGTSSNSFTIKFAYGLEGSYVTTVPFSYGVTEEKVEYTFNLGYSVGGINSQVKRFSYGVGRIYTTELDFAYSVIKSTIDNSDNMFYLIILRSDYSNSNV